MRIVVVSLQSASVVDVLRARLPGYAPEAVASVDEVPDSLPADAVVLLDLEDGSAGVAAARELRERGITSGIVVVGAADTEGLPAVIGVRPPIRVRHLADAFRRVWVEQRSAAADPGPAGRPGRGGETDRIIPARRPPVGSEPPGTPRRRGPAEEPAASAQDVERRSARPPDAGRGPSAPEPARRGRRPASGAATVDEEAAGSLEERVAAVLGTTARVEAIAESLPAVSDLDALNLAVVGTVVHAFGADAVGLWHRHADGWIVAAHHGFGSQRAALQVAADQPVMAELESTAGALLLDPAASFPSMLAGLGDGRHGSFMAAAIAVGQYHLGILTVERQAALEDADLDRLVALGREAALGIGVARHIERMHAMAEAGRAAHRDDVPPLPVRRAAKARGDEEYETPGVIIQLPDHLRGRA